MSLVIECKEHYHEVRKFAADLGQLSQLQSKLDYLDTYGTDVETHCFLYKDFAPHSFYFEMHIRDKRKELGKQWRLWFDGGLIYHGDETGWGVHT